MLGRAADEPAAAACLEAEQLDLVRVEPRTMRGGTTGEVIRSSSGEDNDFGDKESECGETEKKNI